MDSATWAALALTLTLIGAGLSFVAYRRHGAAAGLRGLAWTLLPVAAWLTGTLRLAVDIAGAVTDWAARLVFSPTVWLGLAVGGTAVAMWFLSGQMLSRGIGVRAREGGAASVSGGERKEVPQGRSGRPKPSRQKADDVEGMDEIEAILKKHGI